MNINLWFTSQDLATKLPPPANTIWVGIPMSGGFAGYWCYMDSTGTIYLVGGGIDNFTYRSATISLNVGTSVVTYSTPFAGGTNTTVICRCYDSLGNVDYSVHNVTETGFKIDVPIKCSCDFETRIVNDTPTVV